MRIPSSFKIRGENWIVIRKPKGKVDPTDPEALGLCETEERRITLSTDLKGEKLAKIFTHEYIHASLSEFYLDSETGLSAEMEELVSYVLSDTFTKQFKLIWKKR